MLICRLFDQVSFCSRFVIFFIFCTFSALVSFYLNEICAITDIAHGGLVLDHDDQCEKQRIQRASQSTKITKKVKQAIHFPFDDFKILTELISQS